jgi:hypothetical protein
MLVPVKCTALPPHGHSFDIVLDHRKHGVLVTLLNDNDACNPEDDLGLY